MKILYLNSLFPEQKPNKKAIKLINDAIVEANGVNPKEKPKKKIDGKKFILKHTEDFLNYAIDYSINEKVNEFYQK